MISNLALLLVVFSSDGAASTAVKGLICITFRSCSPSFLRGQKAHDATPCSRLSLRRRGPISARYYRSLYAGVASCFSLKLGVFFVQRFMAVYTVVSRFLAVRGRKEFYFSLLCHYRWTFSPLDL